MQVENVQRAHVEQECFNPQFEENPCVRRYNLTEKDFDHTMEDIYEFLFQLNKMSVARGWGRFEDMLQMQALSNVLSNLLNNTMAKHSKGLVVNTLPNGHPDLIRAGYHPSNKVLDTDDGIEVKATKDTTAKVDMHSPREQDLCTFVYKVDARRGDDGVPFSEKEPLRFIGIFLGHVTESDYNTNPRGRRGTRTSSLNKDGLGCYRQNWLYLTDELRGSRWAKEILGG